MDAPHKRAPDRLGARSLEFGSRPAYAGRSMQLAAVLARGSGQERVDRRPPASRPERDQSVLYPERWAAEALLGLWEANRADGEPYGDCFARLGVPRYTTLLDQVMNPAA